MQPSLCGFPCDLRRRALLKQKQHFCFESECNLVSPHPFSFNRYWSRHLSLSSSSYVHPKPGLSPSPFDRPIFSPSAGFWEILLVFWSLMFVATRQDSEPTLRARNFASSIVVGKRMIMRRSRSLHPKPSESKTERPFWEGVYGGSTENTPSPGRQVGTWDILSCSYSAAALMARICTTVVAVNTQ